MNKIDPRLQLLWFFIYSFLIFQGENLPSQLMLMAFTILGIYISGHNLPKIIKKIRYLLLFLPITFFIHLFFSTTFFSIIISYGLLAIPLNIFTIPFHFTIRILSFIIFMAWFTSWIDNGKILDGIYLLLKPLAKIKVPVDDLFQVIFIAIRFFPILQEEYKKINANWKTYCNREDDENKVLKILNNLVSIIIFSFRKAEKIALAMHIRGYGSGNRTYYTKLKYSFTDFLFFAFSIIFFITMYKLGGLFETIQV